MTIPPSEREPAFRRLFLAHHDAVRAYVLRREPADAADDLVAETFLVAWRRLDDVPDDALPWLIGVARNARRNARRGRARRSALAVEAAAAPHPPGALPSDVVAGRERQGAVLEALRRLRPADREVLTLAAWEGLDTSGLARVLGCSRPAAAVRLHRARRRLERALDPEHRPVHSTTSAEA
jgi:RNA polymerase sigma-70 factor (ECF subfamily)